MKKRHTSHPAATPDRTDLLASDAALVTPLDVLLYPRWADFPAHADSTRME
jgi:hypothetical protein